MSLALNVACLLALPPQTAPSLGWSQANPCLGLYQSGAFKRFRSRCLSHPIFPLPISPSLGPGLTLGVIHHHQHHHHRHNKSHAIIVTIIFINTLACPLPLPLSSPCLLFKPWRWLCRSNQTNPVSQQRPMTGAKTPIHPSIHPHQQHHSAGFRNTSRCMGVKIPVSPPRVRCKAVLKSISCTSTTPWGAIPRNESKAITRWLR